MQEGTAERWRGHVDHVGSLIRPQRLISAWRDHEAGRCSAEELRKIQDESVSEVVSLQEDIGLSTVTDGEFRRPSWSRGFVDAVEGMEFRAGSLRFRDESGNSFQAPAPVATRKPVRLRPIVSEDYKFLKKAVTRAVPKVTMPSPSHFHFGHFSACANRDIYPDIERFWDDLTGLYNTEIQELSTAGCTFLQIDECPLALIFDAENVEIERRLGEDPEQLVDTYVRVTNAALSSRAPSMKVAMHMCRGNAQGMWLGSQGYDVVADKVFNELDIDAYLLEYNSPRAGDFTPLRFLPKGKRAYLGIVSTKSPTIETINSMMRRIDEASQHTAVENIGITPQCGFASSPLGKFNITANPMNNDVQKRKLTLLLDVARRVWG